MKTIKSILAILILVVTANIGLAQKNITIYQNSGYNLKTTTLKVDSITFSDFAAPGTAIFNTYNLNPVLPQDSFEMEPHSKVTWDASYKGNTGVIAGGFEVCGADLYFDEAHPELMHFDGWVQLSKTSTFEPGRDDPTHCVNTSLGIAVADWAKHVDTTFHFNGTTIIDTVFTTVFDSVVPASHDLATLTCAAGDITRYGDGYRTTNAQFTYKGLTSTETVYFKYLGKANNGPYHVIEAEWQFEASATASNPRSCGSSIKSTVHVQMHLKFHHL